MVSDRSETRKIMAAKPSSSRQARKSRSQKLGALACVAAVGTAIGWQASASSGLGQSAAEWQKSYAVDPMAARLARVPVESPKGAASYDVTFHGKMLGFDIGRIFLTVDTSRSGYEVDYKMEQRGIAIAEGRAVLARSGIRGIPNFGKSSHRIKPVTPSQPRPGWNTSMWAKIERGGKSVRPLRSRFARFWGRTKA